MNIFLANPGLSGILPSPSGLDIQARIREPCLFREIPTQRLHRVMSRSKPMCRHKTGAASPRGEMSEKQLGRDLTQIVVSGRHAVVIWAIVSMKYGTCPLLSVVHGLRIESYCEMAHKSVNYHGPRLPGITLMYTFLHSLTSHAALLISPALDS